MDSKMHLHPNNPAVLRLCAALHGGPCSLHPPHISLSLLPTQDLLQLLHKHPLQRCAAVLESHTVSLGALSGVLSREVGHSCASHSLHLLTKALPVTAFLLGSLVKSRAIFPMLSWPIVMTRCSHLPAPLQPPLPTYPSPFLVAQGENGGRPWPPRQ